MEPDTKFFLSSDKAFYTIEGEGPSAGIPALFVRFAMCNLGCPAWPCDSIPAWTVKILTTGKELTEFLDQAGYTRQLANPFSNAILKITGGEPLVQQKQISPWLASYWDDIYDCSGKLLHIEVETNATILPLPELGVGPYRRNPHLIRSYIRFICSPKLANCGEPLHKRYKPEVLEWHATNTTSFFKFVVDTPEDLQELHEQFEERFHISPKRIWLMPECTSTTEFKEKAGWVAEQCKRFGYNFSPRLQILIWEQALGV